MRRSTKNTNPKLTVVQTINKVYSNCSFAFRKEPYLSNDACQSFLTKMKQVYDSVCVFSNSTRLYTLDFEMTNILVTRPLIREAFTLWTQIPHDIRNGLGIIASMHLLSVTETNL